MYGYSPVKSWRQCFRTCHRIHRSCSRFQEVHISQKLSTFHKRCDGFTSSWITFVFNFCGMDGSPWTLLTILLVSQRQPTLDSDPAAFLPLLATHLLHSVVWLSPTPTVQPPGFFISWLCRGADAQSACPDLSSFRYWMEEYVTRCQSDTQ